MTDPSQFDRTRTMPASDTITDPPGRHRGALTDALRFLFPPGYRPVPSASPTLDRAARWFVPLGLVVGLLWAIVFRVTWRLFGETGNLRVVPALSVVLLECLFTGPFLAMGLARTAHLLTGERPRRDEMDRWTPLSPVGTLVLILTLISQYVFIVSIPAVAPWWPTPADWRSHFNFVYPQPIYRPLLLAPLWGRWALLLAATIGRPGHDADADTVALCRSMSPRRLILAAILPMVLTAIYCSRSRNFLIGIIIGMLVFGASFLVAVVMARRGGGQTRPSLFACGQIAQLALLALYRAFWPIIHG
ncbi:MAG: adenosylcobinamide-GDP ribazoletransferase [Phycisphaerae bacterium]